MSDSGSDLSTPVNLPADIEIEQCLRHVVRDAIKKDEEITIKLARSRAEAELGLDVGFFKDNEEWKQRSKELINAAVEEPASPEKMKAKKGAAKSKPKPVPKAGTKRKSDEVLPKKSKKRKESPVGSGDDLKDEEESVNDAVKDSEDSERDEVDEKPKAVPKSEEESALSEPPEDVDEPAGPKQNGKSTARDDDSDLSSVIDDAPPKKKKRQKKSTSPSVTKSNLPKSSKPKPDKATPAGKDLSPDEEEIKRLQSWLLKCGVRKLWHRELAPYSTSKEKIKHLKSTLEEVGMTGRFSAEKARGIKEARELKAELEAAREFNEQWGHESGDEDDGDGERVKEKVESQPTRRLKPKGLVDFGDSGEDSE